MSSYTTEFVTFLYDTRLYFPCPAKEQYLLRVYYRCYQNNWLGRKYKDGDSFTGTQQLADYLTDTLEEAEAIRDRWKRLNDEVQKRARSKSTFISRLLRRA